MPTYIFDNTAHRGNMVEESGGEFVKRDTKKRKENGVFEGVELIERYHKR